MFNKTKLKGSDLKICEFRDVDLRLVEFRVHYKKNKGGNREIKGEESSYFIKRDKREEVVFLPCVNYNNSCSRENAEKIASILYQKTSFTLKMV